MIQVPEFAPSRIEHLVDTDMDIETGGCSFHYNYLLYTFDHPLGVVTARSYLDTPEQVSILKTPQVVDLETELAGVIQYLRARYPELMKLDATGYVTV